MAVPTYDKFIEPVLRFLAGKPDGVPARDAHEAAADALNLDDNQRSGKYCNSLKLKNIY
jgi:restriction system protein